jgi:hypothetical protein
VVAQQCETTGGSESAGQEVMSDFDLDSVLRQIMDGDAAAQPVVTAPPVTTVVTPQAFMNGVCADVAQAIQDAAKENDDAGVSQVGAHAAVSFPTFTNESIAAELDIRNFATLCKLKVRKWVGRKRDKAAAKKAESDHGSVDGTYTSYKKLFAGTEDKLKAVNSVLDSARTRHYQMTLPWSTTGMDDSGRRDGPRLMPNTLFMEYISEMANAKQTMLAKFAELRQAYPQLLIEAQRNLGSAFIPTDYPTPDELEQLFSLEFEFAPIPDGMDFKGLPAQQASKLAAKLTAARNKCLEGACRDVWSRAHDVVAKMAERLGDPKHMFHDTLVTNVRETADLLRHMNPTSDANIETIRQRMQGDLCRFDASVLREDLSKRALVAQLARDILNEMEKAK